MNRRSVNSILRHGYCLAIWNRTINVNGEILEESLEKRVLEWFAWKESRQVLTDFSKEGLRKALSFWLYYIDRVLFKTCFVGSAATPLSIIIGWIHVRILSSSKKQIRYCYKLSFIHSFQVFEGPTPYERWLLPYFSSTLPAFCPLSRLVC